MYAFFGLVSYLGQVLEKGLVNVAVVLQLRRIGSVTRQFVDQLFETMEAKTFGELLRIARQVVAIPESLDKELGEALRKRNYLAHHFFADHSEDFISDVGRREMIEELRGIGRLFSEMDKALDKVYLPLSERLGIRKEAVEAELEAMRARASARRKRLRFTWQDARASARWCAVPDASCPAPRAVPAGAAAEAGGYITPALCKP